MTINYWQLIRQNASFRWLWIAQMVSLMGDWFNRVALMDFISDPVRSGINENGIYISLVLICSFLPQFLISPIAGIIVDRFNRKSLLIASDIIRGFLVLGFLLVNANWLWLLFLIESIVFLVSAFFFSAKAAIMPNIVANSRELVSANALGQTTWGLMLAMGGFLAGAVISLLGFDLAIIINSLTFFISAYFIKLVTINETIEKESIGHSQRPNFWIDFKQGISYIVRDRFVSLLLLVKPGWALGGGAILMLHTVFGKDVFLAGSFGIGILYMCRGLGVVVGSLMGQSIITLTKRYNVLWLISILFVIYGLFYALFSIMPTLLLASIMLIIATSMSSNLWLISRTTLQHIVPDKLRGRIFSHDEGLSTLFMMFSALLAGWGLDIYISPRDIALIAAILMMSCGIIVFIGIITKILPKKSKSISDNLS